MTKQTKDELVGAAEWAVLAVCLVLGCMLLGHLLSYIWPAA